MTVRHIAETDPLLDEVGNTLNWERGINGNVSGSRKDSGQIIIQEVDSNTSDGVLMLDITAQGTGVWVTGAYA